MGLGKYTLRRIGTGFLTILVLVSSLYFLFRLPSYVTGTSPAELYGLQRVKQKRYQMSKEKYQNIVNDLREKMGIPPEDASVGVRAKYFFRYMYKTLTFNFGRQTLPPYQSVYRIFLNRLPYSILLLAPTVFIQIATGISLGIESGKDIGSTKDKGLTIMALSTRSLPSYWIQMMFIFIFVFILQIYPAKLGPTPNFQFTEPFFKFLGMLFMFSLPIVTLVLSGFGSWVYLTRNSLADVMTEDYIFTAKAKGLPKQEVLYKHALRNAILPLWTSFVLSIAWMWTGAVITETVFGLPGLGRLFINTLMPPIDYGVAQMLFYFIGLSVISANVVADVTYGVLDPRVSYD